MAMFGHSRKSKRNYDGSVAGVSYNQFRKPTTPSLGSNYRPRSSYQHDLYMQGMSAEYRPNINAPSVDWNDYETYEPFDKIHIAERDDTSFFHKPIFNVPINKQNINPDTHLVDATNMSSGEIALMILNMTDALSSLRKSLPEGHSDIVNLKNAIHEIINDPDAISKLETLAGDIKPSKLGKGNPYEVDMFEQTAKEYDRQIELFEQSTGQLAQAPHIEEGIMPDVLASEPLAEEQTLEEIVSNQDIGFTAEPQQLMESDVMYTPESSMDMLQPNEMAAEEINNAVNQVVEQPLPQEPDFMQEDPFLIAQQMYNQQMQFMNNPFMMLGP
jgi:hypothetical protein